MKICFSLIFLLLPFAVFSQNEYRFLTGKTYAQRYTALDTIFFSKAPQTDSVTYFKKVSKLKNAATEASDDELELVAELLRLEYYMVGKQWNRPKFEAAMLKLREAADRQAIKPLQIVSRQKLGYYYFYISHLYGPGFENYLESYALLENMPVSELPDKQDLVANIGTAYYVFSDFRNARKFISAAARIPASRNKRLPINLTNTLGLIHQHNSPPNYDSAEYFFRKAYHMAELASDSAWIGITAGNLGSLYFKQKAYEKAKPLMILDFIQSVKANEMDNAVNALTVSARISLLEKDYAKARQQVTLARQLTNLTGDPFHKLKYIFPVLAQLNFVEGNPALAYRYSDSARNVIDSLFSRRNLRLQTNAEDKVAAERYKAEQMRISHETKFRIIRNLAILLTCIIVILIINRQRMQLKQKQQKLQLEKQTIELELESAQRQLTDFTNSIREKNNLLETYAEELRNKPVTDTISEQEQREEVAEQLQKATLLTNQQWEDFRHLFDKVHPGFLSRLQKKLPALSPADTRYIALTQLNLTDREMAAMLGVRPDAIRLYRHRLRKKFDLEDDKKLEELLASV